jgi:platelet-activating factor acetylhydrolase
MRGSGTAGTLDSESTEGVSGCLCAVRRRKAGVCGGFLVSFPSSLLSLPAAAIELGFRADAGCGFGCTKRYFPRLLYYIVIPIQQNASLLPPTTRNKKWPVLVFSHGLGGSHNTYSHLLGSLASHGLVVVAPSHRDGSAPIAYINTVADTDGSVKEPSTRKVEYRSFPHEQSPEVEDGRNEQLEIRLWELGLLHETLLKIDRGEDVASPIAQAPRSRQASGDRPVGEATSDPGNANPSNRANAEPWVASAKDNKILAMFENQLDIHRPGSISWMGHSFGAATIVQFIKSVFYRTSRLPATVAAEEDEPFLADYKPLFTPSSDSPIVQQITPHSAISLLDLWTLPLRGQRTRWLWEKPLPCYAPSGPGGAALLAILSEAFFKWRSNLNNTKRVLSAQPSSHSPDRRTNGKTNHSDDDKPGPRFFYPVASAHLSQSDFGILFPWVTRKVFRAENPGRTLTLNVRAILQLLRENGTEVAPPTPREDTQETEEGDASLGAADHQDSEIFREDAAVEGWMAIGTGIEE